MAEGERSTVVAAPATVVGVVVVTGVEGKTVSAGAGEGVIVS